MHVYCSENGPLTCVSLPSPYIQVAPVTIEDLPLIPLGMEILLRFYTFYNTCTDYFIDESNFGEVFRSAVDIVDTWEDLGTALGLHVSLLSAVETNNPKNARKCMRAVIVAWLQQKGSDPHPSWQSFCKALRDKLVQHSAVADSLEKEILGKLKLS